MTTNIRIYRRSCPSCSRSYTVWRTFDDVRGAPAADLPCAACIGADREYV